MADVMRRENIYSETLGPEQFGIIEKPLTLVEKIYNQAWLRKLGIVVAMRSASSLASSKAARSVAVKVGNNSA